MSQQQAKIAIGFVLGIGLVFNAIAYFTTSSLLYGVQYQQLEQIKSLIWIVLIVYIASKLK